MPSIPRIILLGAGASAEAGIPCARPMARTIYDAVAGHRGVESRVLAAAIGGLRLHHAISEGDPFREIDIEDLYATLRLLTDRHDHLLAPFVGSWSHAVAAAERPDFSALAAEVASNLCNDLNASFEPLDRFAPFTARLGAFGGFRHSLMQALQEASAYGISSFATAARRVIHELVGLCWMTDPAKVGYLNPLVASAKRSNLRVATLNYDNSVELACKVAAVPVDLGLAGRSVRFAESSPVCLAKLHGSVNWAVDPEGDCQKFEEPIPDPAILFGSGNKLRVDGPYLDLLFMFREWLHETDDLTVFGYSFRDQHVNHLLLGWLVGNPKGSILVIDNELTIEKILEAIRISLDLQIRGVWLQERVKVEHATTGEWIARGFPDAP